MISLKVSTELLIIRRNIWQIEHRRREEERRRFHDVTFPHDFYNLQQIY